jgi:hypothetical protein
MKTKRLDEARQRLYRTRTIKLIAIWTLLFASGCGASIGTAAIGSTGFMVEHNRKVELLRDAFTPETRYHEQARGGAAWTK